MLAETEETAFNDQDWVFEIKWDGYRAIADLHTENHLLYSRNGLSYAEKFEKIFDALSNQKYPMIIDGEIVAYNLAGKPDFQALQKIGENPNLAMTYQVFDLLWLNGYSTENLTLLERKELLKEALVENNIVKYCEHIPEKGVDFFNQVKEMQLEGMIAKKSTGIYTEGSRSSDWLKIKFQNTEDVFICGFTKPNGERKYFGAIILGNYVKGKLQYCGRVGTGFSDKTLKDLFQLFKPLITENIPFEEIPKTSTRTTWLKPELICEIKFTEKTKDKIFRHPVFIGLRADKTIEDLLDKNARKGKVQDASKLNKVAKIVKLTNQDKIYFPESSITKGDIMDYYQSISKYILPHLINRPQSLNRFPNGINGLNFYHKDAGGNAPDWLEKTTIFSESNKNEIQYLICNTSEDLAYLNNLGCIDFNPWNSNVNHLEAPDWLALDLDPSDQNIFDDVIETAVCVKDILDQAKIKGFCKTSGSSGIHIFIPMGAQYHVDQVKNFAHLLMQKVHQFLPDLTTLERSLSKRSRKKIYLDYLQNRTGQTLASVYSIRPKSQAPVSMPIHWDELKPGLKPTDFNIHNALDRIKNNGDLFKPVLGKGINMLKSLENLSKF